MGKRDTRVAFVNPVAAARASGPQNVSGPTLKDYLNRPRPSWDEVKSMIEENRRSKGSKTLEEYEKKMNKEYRAQLDRGREKLLNKKRKRKRSSSRSSSLSSSSTSSSTSSSSQEVKKRHRKKKKHKTKHREDSQEIKLRSSHKQESSKSKKKSKHKKRERKSRASPGIDDWIEKKT